MNANLGWAPDHEDDDVGYGDPRRCPSHPWVRTSDRFGMHDAPCGACEYEIETGTPVLRPSETRASVAPAPTSAPAVVDPDDVPF